MYRTLFELAGPAIVAWLLLVFLPAWRVTRRVAESAVFPAYLSLLYVGGIALALRELGPGLMREFGTADGVLRILALEPVALVAWIHILAFDQVVGLLIYRDNMRHRYVPLPVQSAILALTLMFGPVGFLAYWLARMMRRRADFTAWGERDRTPWVEPAEPVRVADVTTTRTLVGTARDLLGRTPALVAVALVAFALAGATSIVAAVNGGWRLAPEGRLLEAAKFDVAVGIFVLTQAAILPLAGFVERRRTRWVRVLVAVTLFNLAMENVQSWRGLDPRFSQVAGDPDRILGFVFFASAMVGFWLFVDLMSSFFRRGALPDHLLLRDALRYGAVACVTAFVVGVAMSVLTSRTYGPAGNLMPIHAAGFHGLQAVPLVALLLGWSQLEPRVARPLLHGAGVGWLLLCAGLVLDAATGTAPLRGGLGSSVAIGGAAVWAAALTLAWRARRAAVGAGMRAGTA